jgi:hypothetical protein
MIARNYIHCAAHWNAVELQASGDLRGGASASETIGFVNRPDKTGSEKFTTWTENNDEKTKRTGAYPATDGDRMQPTKTHPLQSNQAASGDWTLPYGEWSFSFITPMSYRKVMPSDRHGWLSVYV